MIKYFYGSEDSALKNIAYVFNTMPSFQKCKIFCSSEKENRNIIVIKDGIVKDCFKGRADEINNEIFNTYSLHNQENKLIISKPVKRDILMKTLRVIRCILFSCSETKYQEDIETALNSDSWKVRIETLNKIDFVSIEDYGDKYSKEEILKAISFQLGQFLGLLDGKEFYDRSSLSKHFPDLKPFLYCEKADIFELIFYINLFIQKISKFKVIKKDKNYFFDDFYRIINIKEERYID